MGQSRRNIVSHALTALLSLVKIDASWAQKAPITPQPPLRPLEEREDYQQCLAAVIKKDKASATEDAGKLRSKRGIANCRDRYPAVSLLIDCKHDMTIAYRDDPQDLKAALEQCRSDYLKLSFNPKDDVPFNLRDKLIFFAGAGLNHSVLLREQDDDKQIDALYMGENFGNYSCTNLRDTMFERKPPEHLLFGADLQSYPALRHVDHDKLFKAFAWPLPKTPGGPVPAITDRLFGELFLNPANGNVTNYFPSAFCFYNRKLGPRYEGIKIYYLIDRQFHQATPYFGIAFFKPKQGPAFEELTQKVKHLLGDSYQIQQPKADTRLITPSPITQFDDEKDPKNICQGDAPPSLVALTHQAAGSPEADYLILANVANLCRFGDRMASRFLKSGLKAVPKPL